MAKNVEISTHDGITLRGLFYQAQSKAPAVIMSAGLSGIKEHFLPAYAERFQKAGYAVLLYDHRNWGESEGLPRHHSSHYEQTQDTHGVIHFVSTQLDIDPARIALWGSSFSGGIALIAGAIDPRIKAVISQVPFISGETTRKRLSQTVLPKILADRGQTSSSNPTYIPIYPESLEEAQKPDNGAIMGTEECFRPYADVRDHGPQRENKITLQTLFHIMRSEPQSYISELSPRPLLMLASKTPSLMLKSKWRHLIGPENQSNCLSGIAAILKCTGAITLRRMCRHKLPFWTDIFRVWCIRILVFYYACG